VGSGTPRVCYAPSYVQIVSNTTGMAADLCVQTDVDARDHCVVVVKGTFETDAKGNLSLAREQRPLAYTDEYYGEPESSCVRYEGEFARCKPLTDVVVVGKAVAPGGRPTPELLVRLEIAGRGKDVLVVGERRWVRALGGLVASAPVPFVEMPLTFERAFGGQDDAKGPGSVAVEHRNLAGVGFHAHRGAREIEGTALPNLEDPHERITSPRDRPKPVGLGCMGRTWKPRIDHAGTYDAKWRDELCPFLPKDFDPRYFQCAPPDQQLPRFVGGEVIRCVHMAERAVVQYTMPALRIPVRFDFEREQQARLGELDTVILEPHRYQVMLVWRASVPLGKKLVELQRIHVGEQPRAREHAVRGHRRGKPLFAGLAATIGWLRRHRGPAT
jgi:hypothetical protein